VCYPDPSGRIVKPTTFLGVFLLVISGCASHHSLRRPRAYAEASCDAPNHGGLKVRVHDTGGTALPGVFVGVADEAQNELATSQTDSRGLAFFPNLPPATAVVVRARLPGFSNSIAAISTRQGCVTSLSIPLILDPSQMDCVLQVQSLPRK
jgi:hypothetical protein